MMSFSIGCSFQSQHLKNLSRAYPYGLLGNDYGILNEDDLAVNTCFTTEAIPFPSRPYSPYPYWKCYAAKDTSLTCDYPHYDEEEKAFQVIMVLQVRGKEGNHDYLGRRVIYLESCQEYQGEFRNLTKNESKICISGEFWNKKKNVTIWGFDKFKTKKGCVSYFSGYCDLKTQLSEGCVPKPAKN